MIKVLDTGTEVHYVITEFEAVDKDVCDEIGIPTSYKILNKISGTYTSTLAGYNFHPYRPDIRVRSEGMDGTDRALLSLLNSTSSIKILPEKIEVEEIRLLQSSLSFSISQAREITNAVEEVGELRNFRKVFHISTLGFAKISIFHSQTKEVIETFVAFGGFEQAFPNYLWVPIQEAALEELDSVQLDYIRTKVFINGDYVEHFA